MVCFRYIIVNTLHEGDKRDNNNNNNNNNVKLGFCAMLSRLYAPLTNVPPHA